ncbi:hypothetical protein ACFWAZ_26830 [Streptomyces collinus]|uniref:hypothetical protein n=1 Tax=Streptomyces collinus TaxID=42684 RepID=UPI003654C9FA
MARGDSGAQGATCSSSPRSNEPATPDEPNESAQPSVETTVATGPRQVEQTSAQPAVGPYGTYRTGYPQPAAASHQAGPAAAGPVALGSHPAAGAGTQPRAPELSRVGPQPGPSPLTRTRRTRPPTGPRTPARAGGPRRPPTTGWIPRRAGHAQPVPDRTDQADERLAPARADTAGPDEAIRAAAGHRPMEEVTRLVTLLHKEPQEPHVREEALRAAVGGRSVGELIELIDRLGLERLDRNGRRPNGTSGPERETGEPGTPRRADRRRTARPHADREIHRTLEDAPPDQECATGRFAPSA